MSLGEEGLARVWLDGVLWGPGEALVPVEDRGFTLGDALFETLRVANGRPFRLDRHLSRLARGGRVLGIPVPLERIRGGVEEALQAGAIRDGALRITLSRGEGPPGLAPPPAAEPRVVVTVRPYRPPSDRRRGIRVLVGEGRVAEGALTAGCKLVAYGERVAALLAARKEGADDALLRNGRGTVVGGTASNVVVVEDSGSLRTPAESCGALPGVTREVVLELARSEGRPVEEGPIRPEELIGAQEIFLTSSLRGLAPVISLDGIPVGSGEPGPIWEGLVRFYETVVAEETAAH